MYAVPPTWAHGDQTVSAANMNKYEDAIAFLQAALGDENHAVRDNDPAMEGGGVDLYIVNAWRWLHYQNNVDEAAKIQDISGANPDSSLTESETSMAVYDLGNVSWLTPGQVYRVVGCKYAVEDIDA